MTSASDVGSSVSSYTLAVVGWCVAVDDIEHFWLR
jgi:hypothetical protein